MIFITNNRITAFIIKDRIKITHSSMLQNLNFQKGWKYQLLNALCCLGQQNSEYKSSTDISIEISLAMLFLK